MSQISKKRFFYISTGNVLSSSVNTFTTALQIPDHDKYDRVCVTQASIPISYYMIQEGYNTFVLTENGSSPVSITIPAGNYNANSFAIAVQALLNANSPGGHTYTITYPINYTQNNTGLFTYSVNTLTSPISFSFPALSAVSDQFGFDEGSTVTFTPGISTSTLVSTNVMKFISENAIFIHSNIVDNGTDDVLQAIYFGNSIPLQVMSFVNPEPIGTSKKLNSNTLRSVTFSITNDENIPLFLNGVSANFTVMIYRDNDFYMKSQEFMMYLLQWLKENHISEKNDNTLQE